MTTTESILGATKYEAGLQDFLHVKPPSELEKSGVTLSLERDRNIPIPWNEILDETIDVSGGSNDSIRDYFEKSWKLHHPPKSDDETGALQKRFAVLPVEAKSYVTLTFQAKMSPDENNPSKQVAKGIDTVSHELKEGLLIQDGYGRDFICTVKGSIGLEELGTLKGYQAFWKDHLLGVEICFEVQDPNAIPAGATQVEYVDLRARAILEAYDELNALKDFDEKIQESIDDATKDKLASALASLNIEEIDSLQQSVTSLKLRRFDIKRKLQRLVQRANELGYLLFLEDKTKLTFPDGKEREDIKAGQLYRQYRREYRWTTTIDRVECTARRGLRAVTSFLGIESPEPKRWKEEKKHSQIIMDVQEVDVNENPLTAKINELNESHSVYIFMQTPNGYYTSEQVPLREIMFRCERDEAFRRQCAVFIPIVERSMTGRTFVAGYNVFLAPLPGITPTDFPRLSVHETLSYRMTWRETCVGEVANVVNLAPGESRTITVRRSYEQETSRSEHRTSVFDLQESSTTDIATEFERHLERTNEAGWNFGGSNSASVSAPVEGVEASGSMSRSFGYNQTLKSFSKTINKAVRKASQSINRNVREEVSTDTRLSTKISNYDEYTSTIRNINEGRSLNLVFYKLRNRFETGLFLDDLQFRVTPSVEIIAGSGLKDTVTFEATDLERLVEEFSLARLPVEIDETDELRYWRLVVEKLDEILRFEYRAPSQGLNSGPVVSSANAITFSAPDEKASNQLKEKKDSEEELRRKQREAKERASKEQEEIDKELREVTRQNFEEARDTVQRSLNSLSLLGNRIMAGNLDDVVELVAPGFYVDAIVGAVPSTEVYSERMREQMVEAKKADIALTRADADYRLSLASRVGENGNCIVGVMPYKERKSIALGLRMPLSSGDWRLVVDGKDLAAVPADNVGKYMITVETDDQKLLSDDGLTSHRIELRNDAEGRVITQV